MIYMDRIGHMISDVSEDELHAFAKKLGLKKEWFQPKRKHYDLTTLHMRHKAEMNGAALISAKELLKITQREAKICT